LGKRLSSEEKPKWIDNMQGFDFEIIFKKRKDNVVENVLSIIEEESTLYVIESTIPIWLEEVCQEWKEPNSTR
jgi:hypothetical protein